MINQQYQRRMNREDRGLVSQRGSGCCGTKLAPRKVPATRGLGISESPTSDNLTPQKSTKQDTHEVGPDGTGLACPGRSVVADRDDGKKNFQE